MADDVARRVLVPRTPVPSRAANLLVVVGLLSMVVVAVGLSATDQGPLRPVLLVAAAVPVLLGIFAGWFGRLPGLTWLVARSQPRLVLSSEGMTITDERGQTVRVPWPQVAQVRIQHAMFRSPVIGPDGSVTGRIPGALTTPRVEEGGETRLADEIARFHPDVGRALQAQQRATLLVVMLVIAGATIALVIWIVSR